MGKAANVVQKLDKDERKLVKKPEFEVTDSVTSNMWREKWFVNEPGLYRLIFLSERGGKKIPAHFSFLRIENS